MGDETTQAGRLDEAAAYRACLPGLGDEAPDVTRPPGYGYLWNPGLGVLIDEWETDDGRGCEVAMWSGATPERAAGFPPPWPERLMAQGEPRVFSPGMEEWRAAELAGALKADGWLKVYPRESDGLELEPPEGASTFEAALAASFALSGLAASLGGLPARRAVARPAMDAGELWMAAWWAVLLYSSSAGAGWPDLDARLVSARPGGGSWVAVRLGGGAAERRHFILESCAQDWAAAPDEYSRDFAVAADALAAGVLGPAIPAMGPARIAGAFAAAMQGTDTLYNPSLGVMLDFARMEDTHGPVDMAVKFGVDPSALAARLRDNESGGFAVWDAARFEPGCDVDVPEGSRDMGLFAALVARDESAWLSNDAGEIERALLGPAPAPSPAPEPEPRLGGDAWRENPFLARATLRVGEIELAHWRPGGEGAAGWELVAARRVTARPQPDGAWPCALADYALGEVSLDGLADELGATEGELDDVREALSGWPALLDGACGRLGSLVGLNAAQAAAWDAFAAPGGSWRALCARAALELPWAAGRERGWGTGSDSPELAASTAAARLADLAGWDPEEDLGCRRWPEVGPHDLAAWALADALGATCRLGGGFLDAAREGLSRMEADLGARDEDAPSACAGEEDDEARGLR